MTPTGFQSFQRPMLPEPVHGNVSSLFPSALALTDPNQDFSDSPSFRRFTPDDLYDIDNMELDPNNPYDLDDPFDDLLENQSLADSIDTGLSYDATSSTSNSIVHSLLTQSSRASSDLSRTLSGLDGGSERASEERRLEQRQKQIDYGKNTVGYQRYISIVPRQKRRPRIDPETPDKHSKCSKRCWDGLVRQWRRRLHQWDPPEGDTENAAYMGHYDMGLDG
ncbi:hypothetical protein HK097_007703 [Rhizophlyctis rosea]|uniref:Histone RNA hairpin-binding protein RNA-binding domain-containing protein n=1 Tax=Rhizophlyctis rosea TaxID=64517 RepID=A0AAD5SLN0_9FUNG|nr:hypothetical protein HK097_007703 [Rhizophlyctis rosea]